MKTPELLKLAALVLSAAYFSQAATLRGSIDTGYQENLKELFIHFHQNPELSFLEFETPKINQQTFKWLEPQTSP
jgi:hippurate hydrolase